MKQAILLSALLALALSPAALLAAEADFILKIDGVDGESTRSSSSGNDAVGDSDNDGTALTGDAEITLKAPEGSAAPGVEPDEIDNSAAQTNTGGTEDINIGVGELENTGIEPDEIDGKFNDDEQAAGSGYLKIDDIKGESLENDGLEPDEIDSKFSDDPQETNFALLLDSGLSGDDDETEGKKDQIEEILYNSLQEDEVPTEEVAFYYNKISTTHKRTVKIFGVIPVETTATVEIDGEDRVKVKFPWWTFLASGKDKDSLGSRVFNTLSNVMKRDHDTIMSIIRNLN